MGRAPARRADFDDGYVDNFVHALPVLVEHSLTATFFLTTGFVDRDAVAVARMRSNRART
jgi:peptidoglycan/xylan/chitin deacetylase (PgdA/CDA1 family)